MLKCDLWGNITYYEDVVDGKNEWVKQKFVGEDLINYEDSNGNYWDNAWGECTLPILVVESTRMLSLQGYSCIDYHSNTKDSLMIGDCINNWGISNPIIKSNKNTIYLGPSPTFSFSGYSTISGGYSSTVSESNVDFDSIESRNDTAIVTREWIDREPRIDTIVATTSNLVNDGEDGSITQILSENTLNVGEWVYDGSVIGASGGSNTVITTDSIYSGVDTSTGSSYSVIGGGYSNTVSASYGTLYGGSNNFIGGADCYYVSKVKSHYYDKNFYYNGGLTVKEVNDE